MKTFFQNFLMKLLVFFALLGALVSLFGFIYASSKVAEHTAIKYKELSMAQSMVTIYVPPEIKNLVIDEADQALLIMNTVAYNLRTTHVTGKWNDAKWEFNVDYGQTGEFFISGMTNQLYVNIRSADGKNFDILLTK
jgi:hypothetical protein